MGAEGEGGAMGPIGTTGTDPTGMTGAVAGAATGGAAGATGTRIGTWARPVAVHSATIARVVAIVSARRRWLVIAKLLGERCSVIGNWQVTALLNALDRPLRPARPGVPVLRPN